MTLTDRVRRAVVRQFQNPTGPGGHVAGWIMGHRKSNVARNRWAVGLLDLGAHARVLELGCGPGVALAALTERANEGLVVGVDHSSVMIRHAQRRNAAAVADGRVRLVCASAEALLPVARDEWSPVAVAAAPFDLPFDAVLAVNSISFWSEPDARLEELRHLLRPDGLIAVAHQPREPGATDETSASKGREIAATLARAGFSEVRVETLRLKPTVVCALGMNGAST